MNHKNISFLSIMLSFSFALALSAQTVPVGQKQASSAKTAVKTGVKTQTAKSAAQAPAKPAQPNPPKKEAGQGPAAATVAVSTVPAVPKTPVEEAVSKLGSADPMIRKQGADTLGELKDPGAVPFLMKALDDKIPAVRVSVVDALGLVRAREAVGKISEILIKDPDENVRRMATSSLAYIGERTAGKVLVQALKDADAGVRYSAVRTIGTLRYVEAEDALIGFLDDADINMKRSAIETLGQLQSKKAAPEIIKCADSPEPYVKISAVRALGEIGDASSVDVLKSKLDAKEPADLRIESAFALAKLNNNSGLTTAYELIKSPDMRIKQPASNIIFMVGDESSLRILDELYNAEQDEHSKMVLNFARERLRAKIKFQHK